MLVEALQSARATRPAHFKLLLRSDRLDADDPALQRAIAAAAQALAWSLWATLQHRGVDTQTLQERFRLFATSDEKAFSAVRPDQQGPQAFVER